MKEVAESAMGAASASSIYPNSPRGAAVGAKAPNSELQDAPDDPDAEVDADDDEKEAEKTIQSMLDIDGDGDVDFQDLVAAMDAEVEGEQAERLLAQYRPTYILVQTFLCISLWAGGALSSASAAGDMSKTLTSLGGLESFIPNGTMLFNHFDCDNHAWEVWRWLTYQWTHGNFSHIAMNSLLCLLLGVPLEGFHGHWRIIAIFNISVVGGGWAHMVSRSHDSGLVGMSAGCYSLLGIHMADLAMNWSQNRWRKPKLLVRLLLMALDVAVYYFSTPDNPTGHSAHVGGYVTGLIVGILLVRNLKVKKWERFLQLGVSVIGFLLFTFCIVWIALWPPRSIWDPQPWCWGRQVFSSLTFGDLTWHCVRCSEQSCIDEWTAAGGNGEFISRVNFQKCYDQGWRDEARPVMPPTLPPGT
jgi:membrane associated rhomboid family serine protease